MFAHFFGHVQQGSFAYREAQLGGDHVCGIGSVGADQGSRAVHGEVHTRIKRRSGSQRHNGHKAFHNHAAVADHAYVLFVFHHFRSGT